MKTQTWKSMLLLTLVAGLAAGCDVHPTDPVESGVTIAAPTAPPTLTLTDVPGVTEVVGRTGPGSSYALLVPPHWNGELVLYVKGYVQPFLEPTLDMEIPGVRDWLLTEGFAVAWSSYSETGYAVRDGWQRTHQLRGLFASEFGQPVRTYLVGLSLGGLVAEFLAERFPSQYDGTLAMCAPLGGGRMNADYVAHFRVAFDYFYPGVLPGTLYSMPEGYLLIPPDPATGFPGSPAFHAVVNAVAGNPFPAMEMANLEQIDLAYADPGELVTSFLNVLGYQINGANALAERHMGKGFFDNAATWYSGSSDDDALNAGIQRFSADPAAERYLERWWNPTGAIARPFVSIHTSRDPIVPIRSSDVFAARVATAGASHLLLQRTIEGFGHCGFGAPDIPMAFQTLVSWVQTGTKPPA